MTFYVQGLNNHELMPAGKIFKSSVVEKTAAITPVRAIGENEQGEHHSNQGDKQRGAAAYQSVSALPQERNVVMAEQMMSSPVVTLFDQAVVADAMALFQAKQIRHLPVVSSTDELLGMVSERDVLRHLSGIAENDQRQPADKRGEQITVLMKSPVLTASVDTDVRYVARLFVEQRIGALPIVSDGQLKGIMTRSDVLSAVMRHFVLELWA